MNNTPSGWIQIKGAALPGQTLTAKVQDLIDFDGIGSISFTWLADGMQLGIGQTYDLTQADVGKTITVKASYTDDLGTEESLTSQPVIAVNPPSPLQSFLNASGVVRLDLGGYEYIQDVIQLNDGKLLVVGTTYASNDGVIARFNVDGTLDSSFNGTGYKVLDMKGGDDSLLQVFVESSGQIVVGGMFGNAYSDPQTTSSIYDPGLARLNVDGSLDTAFGTNGKAYAEYASVGFFAPDVAHQPDGKYLISGLIYNINSGGTGVARFNPDGSLDAGFGDDGKINSSLTEGLIASSQFLRSDGRILLAGALYGDFALAQLTPTGELDTSFGTNGKATIDFGGMEYLLSSAILNVDGSVLLIGSTNTLYEGGPTNQKVAIARFNSQGILDTSFNGDGKLVLDFGSTDYPYEAIVQADGKLLIAINSTDATYAGSAMVVRLNVDGTKDESFGSEGVFQLAASGTTNYSIRDIALDPAGNIIVSGATYQSDSYDENLLVAKLNPNGMLDNRFSGDGISILDQTFANTNIQDVAFYEDGSAIHLGNVSSNHLGYYNGDIVLISLDATGNLSSGPILPQSITGGTGVDAVTGGSGNDYIDGGSGNDFLYGGSGNDVVIGGVGADYLDGGEGFDTLRGGEGNDELLGAKNGDFIFGGQGDDLLRGGNGLDKLDGGVGNDTLLGALGRDTLTGGEGSDVFRFTTVLDGDINIDLITDYQSVVDRIELSASVFTAFAGRVGQTVSLGENLTYDSVTRVLSYDQDGSNGAIEPKAFAILGVSNHPVTNIDFVII